MSSLYEDCGTIDAEDALINLGLDNVAPLHGDEIEFSCPYEGHMFGDKHPSNHMSADKLVWRCKGCHRSGTLVDLVGKMLKLTPIESLRWLRTRYGEGQRALKGTAQQLIEEKMAKWAATKKVAKRLPLEHETIGPRSIFSMDWNSDHPAAAYARARGFSAEFLESYGYGFDRWTERITIPIHDENGLLVGFKGRAIDPEAFVRYSLLGDREDLDARYGVGYGFDMHETKGIVYGVHRARAMGRQAVVNEGEFNADACHFAGVPGIGLGMSTLSGEQLRIIRHYFDDFTLFLDQDSAGIGATWGKLDADKGIFHDGLTKKLSSCGRVTVVISHEGDAATMSADEIRDHVSRARPWIQVAVA